MYKKLRIHFVGIGGIGMSGIAEVLLNLGYPVSGSDLKKSSITQRLRRRGARIGIGHKARNIRDVDVVVTSSAVAKDNPEVAEAHRQGLSVIRRAEMLAQIMRLTKYGIAVAGTHGKTTTTSLLATVLHRGGLDPTLVIGGRLNSLRSNARLGRGDYVLAEADESDGSFLHLMPTIAVVTNMDAEHMDHYGTFDNYRAAFKSFCQLVPFYGVAVLCGEHQETRALAKNLEVRTQLYGFDAAHDWNARGIGFEGTVSHYDLHHRSDFVGKVRLNLPGMHNVLNSLATVAVARELGIPFDKIQRGLSEFKGVGRRMEVLLKTQTITALDDYGHHPEEIKATLAAIRKAYPGRLVVLFQPHRYTRTRDLFEDFAASFELADFLIVTDIYAASEAPIKGVTAKSLAQAIQSRKGDQVVYLPKNEKLVAETLGLLRPDDVFLSLGAGDVTKIGRLVARELKTRF